MAQIGKPFWNKDVENRINEVFFQAFAELKTVKEAREFVIDFFTPTERINLAKRLGIFILLKNGWDYNNIKDALHISSATIAKIQGKIAAFGMDGLAKFVKKIIAEDKPLQTRGGWPLLGKGKRRFPRKGEGEKRPFLDLPY